MWRIIDPAIPSALCRAAEASWPSPEWPFWHRYNNATANKYATMDRFRIPPACVAALDALALAVVPYLGESFIDYDLHGAGLHMLPPGGFLAKHLDAECHPIRPWKRTHSIVLGLHAVDGGALVLWPETIEMGINRAVIFETAGQWHEVTHLRGQEFRKTLALFAWAKDQDCQGSTSAQFAAPD